MTAKRPSANAKTYVSDKTSDIHHYMVTIFTSNFRYWVEECLLPAIFVMLLTCLKNVYFLLSSLCCWTCLKNPMPTPMLLRSEFQGWLDCGDNICPWWNRKLSTAFGLNVTLLNSTVFVAHYCWHTVAQCCL